MSFSDIVVLLIRNVIVELTVSTVNSWNCWISISQTILTIKYFKPIKK